MQNEGGDPESRPCVCHGRRKNSRQHWSIFPDENGKTNLSLKDVGGELLVISQFTLYADCHKGYRPSFIQAAEPGEANRLYEYFTGLCRQEIAQVETGVFGAHMKVELENDGPFTLVLEELPQ